LQCFRNKLENLPCALPNVSHILRALSANPDMGDIWAWWLKFERQHGTAEQQEAVVKKCIAAEPHHSPTWQSIAKDMANVGKSTREILELVAKALQ